MNKSADSSDKELLKRIKDGDQAAFTLLYERYNKLLYRIALHYLQNNEMAEDAVQHIFTNLWEMHANITIENIVRNYLFTTMKNYVLNTIRNKNSAIEKNYQLASVESILDDSAEDILEKQELKVLLSKAITQLPKQKKIICLLKLDEKLSNQEIADRLNLSANTVKTHYFQAIVILREKISRMLIFVITLILFS